MKGGIPMNDSFYFEMDELHEILEETTDEEEFLETMMDLLGFNDPKYGVFMEKKTSIEYSIQSFKKRYKYKIRNAKPTIRINGHRVEVDLDVNDYSDYERTVSVEYNQKSQINKLILSKDFFELNKKDQDAIIQHEMGHMRLKPLNPSSQIARTRISDEIITQWVHDMADEAADIMKNNSIPQNIKKQYANEIRQMVTDKASALKGKRLTTDEMESLRTDMYLYAGLRARELSLKYGFTLDGNADKIYYPSHIDGDEIEADRYAANRVGNKQLTHAIMSYDKQQMKPHNKRKTRKLKNQERIDDGIRPLTDEEFQNMITQSNKEMNSDYNVRRKMINDDFMQKSDVYKNI